MDAPTNQFCELFAQLGLPADEPAIRRFIAAHSPLPDATRLEEAPFWSPSQARLLREQLSLDADWAVVIDQLSLALRAPPTLD
jgi:hypothetical protein